MTGCRKCLFLWSAILLFGCLSFGQSQNPSKSETIAYEHGLGEPHNIFLDLDIYSMNADGTNVKALTHDSHNNRQLNWSPDGRRIVFIHSVDLFIMDRDGGNPRQLRLDSPVISTVLDSETPIRPGMNLRGAAFAGWSPDGKVVVTLGNPFPTFVLSPDGQDEPHLVFSGNGAPAWSPDGQGLVFSRNVGATPPPPPLPTRILQSRPELAKIGGTPLFAVFTANADGSMPSRITPPSVTAFSPAWSPDGKQIAFDGSSTQAIGQEQIFVVNRDGSGLRQLTNDPNWESCFHPSWSPDGQRIAFACRAVGSCPGFVAGVGQVGPWVCVRRIFVVSVQNPPQKLIPINDQDGVDPSFAPVN
jgi:Tol biopolymer transport system component